MKSEELRIGNCVYHNHSIGMKLPAILTSGKDIDLHEEFKPIPLTEEWHNKFGIKKNGFNSFEYTLPRKLNIKIKVIFSGDYVMLRQGEKSSIDDDIVSIWNKDLTKRDMFVHEWQNLYYTLTGEELTIK